MDEPLPVEDLTHLSRTRTAPPVAVVLHSTGDTDLAAVLRYYRRGGVGPHYLIDADGALYQFVAESQVAWHAGIRAEQAGRYRRGPHAWERADYPLWSHRWPGLGSPLELVTGDSPNQRSVGIECLALHHPTTAIFSDAQYDSMSALVAQVCKRWSIPLDREHVLTHSDVNPLARGDRDPGSALDWSRLGLTPPAQV